MIALNDNFSDMKIASGFLKRLEERGIIAPTDIQKKIIPRLASGQNVFFTSATGTGKTFAYLLPILSNLIDSISQENAEKKKTHNASARFVIVAPTLELSAQIKTEIDFLLETDSAGVSGGKKLKSSLIIGSANIDSQIEELKRANPDIIAGNLNRLLMLSKMGKLKFSALEFLVFDEADRLVSGDMLDDMNELCGIINRDTKKAGRNPVIAACSATINKKCMEKLLSNCFENNKNELEKINFIESDDNEILREKIEHWAIFSEKRRKDQTLRSLLAALNGNVHEGKSPGKSKKTKVKALIFTSKNDDALFVLSRLQHHHVSAAGLFGKAGKKAVSGENRKEALDSFREGKVTALVSTDLAARGLDIQNVTHIIALDVPSDKEIYIHRCGRTARAGKTGVMVTIGDETQMRLLASLEKKLKIKIYPKELRYGQICAPLI